MTNPTLRRAVSALAIAIALAALPAIYLEAHAHGAAGGRMGRTGGCGGMMGPGMMGGGKTNGGMMGGGGMMSAGGMMGGGHDGQRNDGRRRAPEPAMAALKPAG